MGATKTPCSFTACDPSVPGGCPCLEVRKHGGGMSCAEIAHATGMTYEQVRHTDIAAMAKLRRAPAATKRKWASLMDWPEPRRTFWQCVAGHEAMGDLDVRGMSEQLSKRAAELGWDLGEGRRALRIVSREETEWNSYAPEDEDAIRSLIGATRK